jgi:hypothetical protein
MPALPVLRPSVKKAIARRLDPNKWFGNVELVVSQSVGQMTVEYVSNIYKY